MAFWVLCKLIAILYTHILEISERSEEDSATSFLSFVSLLHIHYRMFPKQNGGKREMFSIAYSIMNVNKSRFKLCVPFLPVCRWWLRATQNKARSGFSARNLLFKNSPTLSHICISKSMYAILWHISICTYMLFMCKMHIKWANQWIHHLKPNVPH